ncbi:major facilitator superfamily domain-containing protein [Cladochytrium replicatum]|nr:major facilitator superfamily domain-containing protein [Cladochytrium replicatum]
MCSRARLVDKHPSVCLVSSGWDFCFIFALPSSLLLKKLWPSRYFAITLVASGVIICISYSLHNLAGLVVTRLIQGVFNAGFTPCIVVYMQMFYRYDEMALRLAAISWIAELYSTFSRPLLPLIFGMKGWRLAVLFEGIAIILTGTGTWFLLPDFPQTCKFLTPSDRSVASQRVLDAEDLEEVQQADQSTPDLATFLIVESRVPSFRFEKEQLIRAVSDQRTWLFAAICGLLSLMHWSLVEAGPLVALASLAGNDAFRLYPRQSRFSSVSAELRMSVLHAKMIIGASTVGASVFGIASGYQSDRTGERALHVGIPVLIGSSALLLAAVVPGPWSAVETSLAWYGPEVQRVIENPQLSPPDVNITTPFSEILNEDDDHAVLSPIGEDIAEIEAEEAVDEFVDNDATKLAYGFRLGSLFLAEICAGGAIPIMTAWAMDGVEGSTAKVVVAGVVMTFSSVGMMMNAVYFSPSFGHHDHCTRDTSPHSAHEEANLPFTSVAFVVASSSGGLAGLLILWARWNYRDRYADMLTQERGLRRLMDDTYEDNVWGGTSPVKTMKIKDPDTEKRKDKDLTNMIPLRRRDRGESE